MPSLFPRRSLSFLKGTSSKRLPSPTEESSEFSPPLPTTSSSGSRPGVEFPTSRPDRLSRLPSPALTSEEASYSASSLSHKNHTATPWPHSNNQKAGLIRKVSSILRTRSISSSTRRTPKLSNASSVYGPPVCHMATPPPTKKKPFSRRRKPVPEYTIPSSDEEEGEESIDEIRRPSGLGDSVSIRSLKTAPNGCCSSPYYATTTEEGSEGGSPVERNTKEKGKVMKVSSTPNLLSTVDWHGEINLPGLGLKRTSYVVGSSPSRTSPGSLLGKPLPPRPDSPPPIIAPTATSECSSLPELPVEVIQTILTFLPRHSVTQLARVSRVYCTAARRVLYRYLDLKGLSRWRIPLLLRVLARNPTIAEVVYSFRCPDWPPLTTLSPIENDDEECGRSPARGGGDCLAYALERMGYLSSLTLPDIDRNILSRHSAFGLTHLSFHMKSMDADARVSLLSWLDGQINITSLSFPNLRDAQQQSGGVGNNPSASTSRLSLFYHSRSLTLPDIQADALEPPKLGLAPPLPSPTFPHLSPSPSPNGTPSTTPLSETFPSLPSTPPTELDAQASSTTLLPSLTHLQAPVSWVELLAPSRPLKSVFVSVDTTLYSGLRPMKLMNALKGITKLGLKFGERVDRRTVEKLLGAVGSVLGSGGDGFPALEELEIEVYFQDAGSEDVLYKILHTVLPRYKHIKSVKLVRLPSIPRPTTPETSSRTSSPVNSRKFPCRPPSPIIIPPPSPTSSIPHAQHSPSRSLTLKTPTRTSFRGADTLTPPPSPFIDYHQALTERDQVNLSLWLKQAPSLNKVTLLSGAVWERNGQDEGGGL